jgi:hypothetical protein
MLSWLKKRRLHVGREVVRWPAKDLREDLLIADLSRLGEGLVGVRRRRYGVYRLVGPPPPYPEQVEWIGLSSV